MTVRPGLGILGFLVGTLVLIAIMISIPSVEFYTGGVIIACFIIGLFYVFTNAVRQGNRMKNEQPAPLQNPMTPTEEPPKPSEPSPQSS